MSVAGKPDLIATHSTNTTIIDVKTGRPNPAHIAQVMLYMWAIPRALTRFRGLQPAGLVAYNDHEVPDPR